MPNSRQHRSHKLPQHDPTCCGVIEQATIASREKRANRVKPQPWIVLKMMVGITLGIFGYASYVYIGRFCVNMIKRKPHTGAGRGTGIALLVVFAILLLWSLWAYMKVVFTHPGIARDFVQKSTIPPAVAWEEPQLYYPDQVHARQPSSQTYHTRNSISTGHGHFQIRDTIGGPSYEDISSSQAHRDWRYSSGEMQTGLPTQEEHVEEGTTPGQMREVEAGVLDALPNPASAAPVGWVGGGEVIPNGGARHRSRKRKAKEEEWAQKRSRMNIARRPPSTPVLLPVNRYCATDEIVKPYRAHHCRTCGTCVLKYDHHCPWIGQCVGARNHKFFVNFCQAAGVLSLYSFSTLLAYTVRSTTKSGADVDPQLIVIIALAALFGLFTTSLTISHVRLIWQGQSTVESMHISTMKERESHVLQRAFGFFGFRAKQQTLREWNAEWGNLDTEGHIWWLGSGRKEWVDVMGPHWWGWFLPIGRSMSDGLDYPVNPRFDEQGRWRRRAEWPETLR